MSEQKVIPGLVQTPEEESEVDFLGLATTLGQEKKIALGVPLLFGLVAMLVSLMLPPVFTATTTLLPPSGSSGGSGAAAAALASLGSLGGLAGGIGSIKTPDEQYVAMLQSRTIKDAVLEKFDLMTKYKTRFREDVHAKLTQMVNISSDKKTGIITIRVDNADPVFAANLANGYVAALGNLLSDVALTDAQKKRLFFETQFAKAKNDLSAAEVRMKELQEKTGLVQIEGQAEASIQAVASARAEIAKREVELTALRTFATPQNPDYQRIVGELNGLRAQLRKLEKGSGADMGVPTNKLPEAGLAYVRALREVKYNEAIFEIMAKQFELAKIDEAKDAASIQQLDVAVTPERTSGPNKRKIVITASLVGLALGVLLAFLKAALTGEKAHSSETQRKLALLKKAWVFRGKSL